MEKDKIFRVAFIAFLPQMWKSLRPLYDAVKNAKDAEAIIIAVGYDVKWGDISVKNAEEFWLKEYPDSIFGYKENDFPSLSDLNVDFVFRQTPYDFRYPKKYSNYEISKNSRLCYAPYNYNFSAEKHLLIEYDKSFLENLDILFSDSRYIVDYCESQQKKYADIGTIDMYYVGSMALGRYHSFRKNKMADDKAFTILWIPRWSTDSVNNHGTSFFKFFHNIIEYFKKNKDINCIIRPHPFMFEQFIETGRLTNQDVTRIMNEIDESDNISFDFEMEYIDSFEKSDVLLADYSSLIAEYYLTCKPIIVCDEYCDWNSEPYVVDMSQTLYYGFTWKDVEEKIERLKNGCDDLEIERSKVVSKYLPEHMNVEEKIVNILRLIKNG